MLDVSDEFKKAIKKNKRETKSRIEVFFEEEPTIFYDDEVISIDLIEEGRADDNNPLGLVSSNEITVSFDNSSRDFTPTNNEGKYSKFMRPDIKIKAFIGVVLEDKTIEYVPLGTFKAKDWNISSESTEATVTAFDRMFDIADMEIPMLPILYNTTTKDMFIMLLKSVGIKEEDIVFEGSIDLPIKNGWFKKGAVLQGLQTLCRYNLCNIFVNRNDKFKIQANNRFAKTVATYTDDDMILSTQNPQRFGDSFSKVRVGHNYLYLKETAKLIELKDIPVENGITIIKDLEFSDSPCIQVTQVALIDSMNVEVIDYGYGANSMFVKLENVGDLESITLLVEGRTLGSHTSSKESVKMSAVEKYGEVELKQFNHLMQDGSLAWLYSDALLDYVSDSLLNYEINYRGDPSLELFDAIETINNANKIGRINLVPYRHTLHYDGTLSGTIKGRKL